MKKKTNPDVFNPIDINKYADNSLLTSLQTPTTPQDNPSPSKQHPSKLRGNIATTYSVGVDSAATKTTSKNELKRTEPSPLKANPYYGINTINSREQQKENNQPLVGKTPLLEIEENPGVVSSTSFPKIRMPPSQEVVVVDEEKEVVEIDKITKANMEQEEEEDIISNPKEGMVVSQKSSTTSKNFQELTRDFAEADLDSNENSQNNVLFSKLGKNDNSSSIHHHQPTTFLSTTLLATPISLFNPQTTTFSMFANNHGENDDSNEEIEISRAGRGRNNNNKSKPPNNEGNENKEEQQTISHYYPSSTTPNKSQNPTKEGFEKNTLLEEQKDDGYESSSPKPPLSKKRTNKTKPQTPKSSVPTTPKKQKYDDDEEDNSGDDNSEDKNLKEKSPHPQKKIKPDPKFLAGNPGTIPDSKSFADFNNNESAYDEEKGFDSSGSAAPPPPKNKRHAQRIYWSKLLSNNAGKKQCGVLESKEEWIKFLEDLEENCENKHSFFLNLGRSLILWFISLVKTNPDLKPAFEEVKLDPLVFQLWNYIYIAEEGVSFPISKNFEKIIKENPNYRPEFQ
jgi:hypothetical protein